MTGRGIVVMAHARSGSNSLVEILNLALVKPLVNEPFNEDFTTWSPGNPDYLGRVTDEGSMDAVVDEILEAWSGLKILSYQLDVPLLRHLLLRTDLDVVFLRRRNLLEAVVSNLIAMQTKLWKTWDADGPIEPRYVELEPLSIDEVRGFVGWHQTRLAEIDSILRTRADGRIVRLVYEDLFLVDRSQQDRVLADLWHHLEVEPLPTSERVAYYLDPSEVQMASAATYGRLPNAAEINVACGSDETGWLTYLD